MPLLKCFFVLIVMVWRSVADAWSKIPLGNVPSDLDPEAFDRASIVTVVDFCTFMIHFNPEHSSSSSTFLPVLTEPIPILCDPLETFPI